MPDNHPPLTEEDKARIREEMRYAMAVIKEGDAHREEKSKLQKLLGYLSNGFILLLVGSLITSVAVPYYQNKYDSKKQELAAQQECLAQFLLYANSIWQEYYLIFPLAHKAEINLQEYNDYIKEIGAIKLRRFDAYAKLEALATVYRHKKKDVKSPVEEGLEKYAIKVNDTSEQIHVWLEKLYCVTQCVGLFDPEFSPHDGFVELQKLIVNTEDGARGVAEQMVTDVSPN